MWHSLDMGNLASLAHGKQARQKKWVELLSGPCRASSHQALGSIIRYSFVKSRTEQLRPASVTLLPPAVSALDFLQQAWQAVDYSKRLLPLSMYVSL